MRIEQAPSIFVVLALATSGCPRDQYEPLGPEGTSGGQETAEGNEAAAGTTAVTPGDSTTMVDPSADSTGDSGGTDCEGPEGCYSCAPTTPTQVLNACTDAICEAFPDTRERLPLLEPDGSLPPIP